MRVVLTSNEYFVISITNTNGTAELSVHSTTVASVDGAHNTGSGIGAYRDYWSQVVSKISSDTRIFADCNIYRKGT